ncbi:MAG TPA: adenosine deaminase [Gemmatimonadota bacterium]|nr:adenosine deaminase [Gemmatimonadota bacterium]
MRRGWLLLALLLPACAILQRPEPELPPDPTELTAETFDRIRDNPPWLAAFLRDMPKGGDIHSHLTGAIYAESYIRWAVEGGLCLERASLALVAPPCEPTSARIPAAAILANATLYGDVIDAWSLRNWHPSQGAGQDHFAQAFLKFRARDRTGDMLAEVTSRAAGQRISYLELLLGPRLDAVMALGREVDWIDDPDSSRALLLAAGLRDTLAQVASMLDSAEGRWQEIQNCDTPDADAGCDVTVRYLYQVLRSRPANEVFAQILAAFELARMDSRVVGFNLVQAEDSPLSMLDFSRHMAMIDALHEYYPEVQIALHAGELTEGLVPPEALRFHIRASIEQGHASRISHGVSVMHENDAQGLLRMMAEREILVEVALSSNDALLGVSGNRHPLRAYLEAGVPIALVTDDEGVTRTTLTREFQRAVEEHGLDYWAVRRIARSSLEHAFVEQPEKERLLAEFDAALREFELRWANPPALSR